jgi:hypothetical protein
VVGGGGFYGCLDLADTDLLSRMPTIGVRVDLKRDG